MTVRAASARLPFKEELQATNEALEATHDELNARTSELQELTRSLTTEQGRLTEIVQLAPFYILVARGPSLVVESETYWQDVNRVSAPLRLASPPGPDPVDGLFVHTIVPIHDSAHRVDGVVIYAEHVAAVLSGHPRPGASGHLDLE